ncbi:histidine kinase [Emticicia sp. SJ17W-69]|uniref:sensor histidine kinase n=1 Tax=Emticicia sp. SJ17W-69 TaxID=3421657 RepID=UPI003EBED420
MQKHLLFFVYFFTGALGICQSPLRLSFHHLTRENGLSNNNILYLYSDSRGFLWLGSHNGLNRFDGINCKVYKTSNSTIKGTQIKNIIEDKEGNLWIGSDVGLNFYDRKKDIFTAIPSPNNEKTFSSFPHAIDDKGLIWVVLHHINQVGLYTYDPILKKYTFITDKVSEQLSTKQNTDFQAIKTIYCGGENDIGLRKVSIKNNKVTKIEDFFDGKKQSLPIFKNIKEYILAENDSTLWITGDNQGLGLMKFNPLKNTFQSFTSYEKNKIPILTQAVSYKNYLLIGATEGLYVFDKKELKFVQLIQHSSTNVNSLMANWNEILYIDKNDNLFLSQLGFGVDYTNLNRVIAENWVTPDEGFSDNHVAYIKKRGNTVWAKLQNGGTIVLNENGRVINKYNEVLLLIDTDNRVWLTNGQYFLIVNSIGKQTKKILFKELAGKLGWQPLMIEINRGSYLIATENGLYEYNEQANKLHPLEDFNQEKTIANSPIFFDKNTNQLFVSANWWSVFYVLEKKSNNWEVKKQFKFPFTVVAIRPSNKPQKLWLGTNKGLVLFDTKTFDYQVFTENEGLPDNSVTDIVEEANGNYWLVTNRGIAYYNNFKKTYQSFTSKDGAYSNEYDWNCAFKLSDGRMVFGGTSGITLINQDAIKRYGVKPKIQITQLMVNEKPLKTERYIGETNEIELEANQNSFAFDLVGIEYGFPQKVKIQYQLQGSDRQWIMVNNPATVRYSNVAEGTHQLMVKAIDEDERVSSEIRTLTVVVNAPFYRTMWFRFLLLTGLLSLGYLLYHLTIKQIQEETQKKEEIRRIRAEAEINALRSQMNPHFIFNCLNTIDSYILLNKTDEASEFLNKFSKLIRMILENSRQEFVPLEQDLKALELYIKLEQERSYQQFTYDITLDKKLQEEEFYIPSMILQPFVENAILHGLRHKKDAIGELFINVQMADIQESNKSVVIHIIDNGIGREASQKINSLTSINKHSVGIKLTEERIQKLSEIYPNMAYLKVKDINEPNDKGTIIEIGLPLLTQQNIY